MIVVVIVLIHDPDSKRTRISKLTKVDPLHDEVFAHLYVVGFDQRVNPDQLLTEFCADGGFVMNRLPQSIVAVAIKKRVERGVTMQVVIDPRDIARPLLNAEILV